MKLPMLVAGIAALIAASAVNAEAGADLLKANKCLSCHAMDKKKVGPAFKDVAIKYKGDKAAR